MKNQPSSPGKEYKNLRDLEVKIGERIRVRRIEIGLTQQDLAKRLGLSYQQIQKYETGLNRISAGRLYTVAKILGCSLDYFFKFEKAARPLTRTRKHTTINLHSAGIEPGVRVALVNLVSALNKAN